MSHEIGSFDKVVGVEQAWHGLSEVVEKIIFDNSGLNYEILEVPLSFALNGKVQEFSRNKGIIGLRPDGTHTSINAPRNSYTPIQNRTVWDVLENSLQGVKHRIVSSGSVFNGAKTFISVEIDGNEWAATNGDQHKSLLNFTNSHDGSMAFEVSMSDVRIVCANTLRLALVSKEGLAKMYHTKGSAKKIEGMETTIAAMFKAQSEFSALCERLGNEKVTQIQAEQFFTSILTTSEVSKQVLNKTEKLMELFNKGRGNKGENKHDVLNATTEFFTHSNNNKDKMKNFISSEFATGAGKKTQVLNFLSVQDSWEAALKEGEELLLAA